MQCAAATQHPPKPNTSREFSEGHRTCAYNLLSDPTPPPFTPQGRMDLFAFEKGGGLRRGDGLKPHRDVLSLADSPDDMVGCVEEKERVAWAFACQAHGYIAQWLERLTADQQVPGSNPGVPSLSGRCQCSVEPVERARLSSWSFCVGSVVVPEIESYIMSTPGVEPGLSRPQRDVLTTRRCGPHAMAFAMAVRSFTFSRYRLRS